jgi:hypothetical protein
MSYWLRGADGDGLGVFDPPPAPAIEDCYPTDSACVARNQVLTNAYALAVAQAQAQNNIDQCMANAANATPGAQYDAAVAACHGQYQQQSPTEQTPSYVAPSNPTPASGGALTFTTSRGDPHAMQVGDTWHVSITGATPNAPVTVSGNMPSGAFTNTPMGTTDGSGNFSKSGQVDASTVGFWAEIWSVGGQASGFVTFTVSPASATAPATPPQTPAAGMPATPPTPPATGSTNSSTSSIVGGFDLSSIPTWGWLLAAAGVALFAFGGGRGR